MILDKYIGKNLAATSAVSLLTLIAVSSFFSLVDQLDNIGVGNYGLNEAIQYVLLTIPRLSFELFPVATVIGSMATLGMMANNNELAIIHTSGVSKQQLAFSLMKTGVVFVLISIMIGEFVAPASEYAAQQKRSIALTKQVALKTKNGFWTRDANDYINIKKVLPNNYLEDIYIYEFDNNHHLKANIHAKHAKYNDNRWVLYDVMKIHLSEEQITTTHFNNMKWDTALNPEVIEMTIVKPEYLSFYGLINYIKYLRVNNQNSKLYLQALWSKIINPFMLISMILLAVCIVKCDTRTIGLGKRVFTGALIGIIFHLINQVSGHLGIVYGVPAFISASLPTMAILGYIYYSLRQRY